MSSTAESRGHHGGPISRRDLAWCHSQLHPLDHRHTLAGGVVGFRGHHTGRVPWTPYSIIDTWCHRVQYGVPGTSVLSSGEDRSKPLRDGFLEMTQLPVIDNGNLTVRDIQVAVVVDQDMR